jgi:hypothetical protein
VPKTRKLQFGGILRVREILEEKQTHVARKTFDHRVIHKNFG